MSQDNIDINVYKTIEEVTIDVQPNVTVVNVNSVGGGLPVTKTSELINDGENGVDPFITLEDLPPIVEPTGLEAINEGNGIGWRLIGRNPDNYGNIGLNATDLSTSDIPIGNGDYGAIGNRSYAQGYNTIASGTNSHAEGNFTTASGSASHAEGQGTIASTNNAHAEGNSSVASGTASHAEGTSNTASGASAHAEGNSNVASGSNSHAEGQGNFARATGEHSGGRFGSDYTPTNTNTDRLINYGRGTSSGARSDAFTLFRNGAVQFFRATLASITNATSGFFIFNSENANRPTIHNGTSWKALAYTDDLSTLVPYTGATTDVDLGENGISTGFVKFDTTPTDIPELQGTMFWDEDDNTVDVILNGYRMKIGEDTFYPVKNQSGSTITKGTNVKFAGTVGASGRLLILPFLANGTDPSYVYMGVAAEDIADGEDGKVLWFGRLRGLNTNAFNEGDILYASTTSAGGFQTAIPTGANNIVQVSAVITKSINQGVIFIRPQIEPLLFKPENVANKSINLTSPDDVKYPTTLAVSTALSGKQDTLVSATNIKTINGNSVLGSGDLVVGGSTSLAIGTTPITSGTIGRVLFEGTGNVLQQSANLFWDNTNARLGVGATPLTTVRLDVRAQGALSTDIAFRVRNSADTSDLFSTTGSGDSFINTLRIGKGLNNLSRNLVFGDVAGNAITTGIANVFIGTNNGGVNTSGTGNTFIGDFAGNKNTSGNFNSFIGIFGGSNNITGGNNTTLGAVAGQNLTSSNNVFIGHESGNATTSGGNNIALGKSSFFANITGVNNTAIGNSALSSHTNGNSNTALGLNSLIFLTTGNNNLAIGASSGQQIVGATNLTSASNSTFLGFLTKSLTNGSTNEIVIGYNAEGLGSNTVVLGNDSILRTALKGNVLINTTTDAGFKLDVNGTARVQSTLKVGAATTQNASSVLDVESTTGGFLPPRMTNAQRLAIASPAVGLIVYCTDVVEGLYVNKSTGWTFVI